MNKLGKHRSLASLALLRLSENDLRSLHAIVSEMSPGLFLELVRDIEDEIDNSMELVLSKTSERPLFDSSIFGLYHEINQIRKKNCA